MSKKLLYLFLIVFQTALIAGQGISLAGDYQKNSGLQWEWAIESLKQIEFEPNDKVLDVGCGDGKITALIAKHVPQGYVVGMDISEKMLVQASNTFKKKNLQFIQGNAIAIPYSEKFDKVVSFCTLHWVLDQKQALKSMRDSLKPGGMLLLVLPGQSSNNLVTISDKLAHTPMWAEYFPDFKQERVYFTSNDYRNLVLKSNLAIHSVVETESVTLYENKAALIAWITPLMNFIDHITPEQQKLFIEDIADQMLLNDPPKADGSIPIRHLKIEVIAIKNAT